MRVLISGAGIAGPALAWFLQKAGARVTVIEKSYALLPHGQNVDLQGSGITAIEKMGLIDQIRQYNTREKGTQLIDAKGQPFAPFPVKKGSAASPSSEFEILRGDLAAVLYRATEGHENVDYLFDTTVKEVISNNDDGVKVALSNGEVREFDLLVAADGQWSKVRQQSFAPESVSVIDTGMYAAYFTVPRIPDDNDWWNVFIALKSRIITIRPDPHGTARAMFTIMPRDEAQKQAWREASRGGRQMQEELLRTEFADAGWQSERLLDAMKDVPDFYFQHVQQIKMAKWSNSRIVCLGDAAYAPSPLTGMGTTLAITGAYVLAGELSKLAPGEHPSKALEAYESTLRPFVEETQAIPFFFPGIMHPQTAWKRRLVQASVSSIAKVLAIPWILGRLPTPEKNDMGFPLPIYPRMEHEL